MKIKNVIRYILLMIIVTPFMPIILIVTIMLDIVGVLVDFILNEQMIDYPFQITVITIKAYTIGTVNYALR